MFCAVAVALASQPQQEDGTLTYKGWTIYPPSNSTSVWTATKSGFNPLSDDGLADILAGIEEAER